MNKEQAKEYSRLQQLLCWAINPGLLFGMAEPDFTGEEQSKLLKGKP